MPGQTTTDAADRLAATQDIAIPEPFLEPQPRTPTCSVRAEVDISTQYFDAIALAQPTVSPVPTAVLGNITFNITNLLPSTIEVVLD